MPRYIFKLEDPREGEDEPWYLVWSTVVDAPVTYGMRRDELQEYYLEEWRGYTLNDFKDVLQMLEETGHSIEKDRVSTLDDLIFNWNRAGRNETHIGREEMFQLYCIDRNM